MIPLVTGEEMQRLDRAAIDEIGIPALVLMETAGRAVADVVEERIDAHGGNVLAVAGSGNNGGDAIVAARHLMNRGVEVTIALCADRGKISKDLAQQLAIAEKLDLPIIEVDHADTFVDLLAGHEVIADGLFGTGLTRPIEGLQASIIEAINAAGRFVVAIDVPSGIHAETGAVLGVAVEADVTVTFALPKLGLLLYPGRKNAGQTRVADIGIPYSLLEKIGPRAFLIDESILEDAFPPRDPDSHKGTYGHVAIIGGTPDRPGSALLAARAAFRTGAGLVTIGSDDRTIERLAPAFAELMGHSLGPDIDPEKALQMLDRKTALVIGMSLTDSAMMRRVIERAEAPVVIDAGALDAIGSDPSWLKQRKTAAILTPHPGEAARVAGLDTKTVQADRVKVARNLAEKSGAIVVLKGASTIIAGPSGEISLVSAGNPGMATGGSGDVLAGIIGGLLAQGLDPLLAARGGVYLHAAAGDAAREAKGEASLVASDLIDHLAGVLTKEDV